MNQSMPPFRYFPYIVGSLLRDVRQQLDKLFQSYELTRYEWMIVALVQLSEGKITQTALREYIGIDNSYLTKMIDKLAKKELIIKTVDEQDKRARIICMHPSSQHITHSIHQKLRTFNDNILSGVSEQERETLFNLLTRIHQTLQKT